MPRGEPALLGADYATLRSLRFVFLCLPRMPTVCKLASGCVTFLLRVTTLVALRRDCYIPRRRCHNTVASVERKPRASRLVKSELFLSRGSLHLKQYSANTFVTLLQPFVCLVLCPIEAVEKETIRCLLIVVNMLKEAAE